MKSQNIQKNQKTADLNFASEFQKGFNKLCGSRHRYSVWSDLMTLYAIGIQNSCSSWYKEDKILKPIWENREKRYYEIMKTYSENERQIIIDMFTYLVMEFDRNQNQDFLGKMYMLLNISNNVTGQFFTPCDVCAMMSNISIDENTLIQVIKEKGYASVNDCAVGGAATLISAANRCKEILAKGNLNYQNHVYFVGNDVDIICCYMAYIQLSLIGVSAIIINTNTLSDPNPNFNENAEKYFFTPIYFSDTWTLRRMFHGLNILMQGQKSENKISDNKNIAENKNNNSFDRFKINNRWY